MDLAFHYMSLQSVHTNLRNFTIIYTYWVINDVTKHWTCGRTKCKSVIEQPPGCVSVNLPMNFRLNLRIVCCPQDKHSMQFYKNRHRARCDIIRTPCARQSPVTPLIHNNWRLRSKNKHSLSRGIHARLIIHNSQRVCRWHEWVRNIPANVRPPAKHIASFASMPINKFFEGAWMI